MLLEIPGVAIRNKKLLSANGVATRRLALKDAASQVVSF